MADSGGIYPRALTGRVNKSSDDARKTYLRAKFPELSKQFMTTAGSCEDTFDAAVSAFVMQNGSTSSRIFPSHRSLRTAGRKDLVLTSQRTKGTQRDDGMSEG